MKASFVICYSLAVLAVASPLGDRALFKKKSAVQHSRRYLLQSRIDSPPACAASSGANTTAALPDGSNSTTTILNSTSIDGSPTADNSTLFYPEATDDSTTIADNSASLEASSRRRRSWKRLAQDDLPDVALSWQRLCLVSGGDIFTLDPCVTYAGIDGINALLVDADPCAQQDNADAMITFAKSDGVTNSNDLIANAIAYRRHPRNAVDILGVVPSTPYCQRASLNPELDGVVNEQLDGVDPGLFGSPEIPIIPFGAPGTCPFGMTPDVDTCSCVDETSDNGVASATVETTGTVTADNSTATDASTDSTTATATSTSIDSSTSLTSVDSASADSQTSVEASNSSATLTSTDASSTADIITSVSLSASGTAATTTASSTLAAVDLSTASTSQVTSVPSASPVATPGAPVATTTKSSGPNFQPPDISGDVNDIDG